MTTHLDRSPKQQKSRYVRAERRMCVGGSRYGVSKALGTHVGPEYPAQGRAEVGLLVRRNLG